MLRTFNCGIGMVVIVAPTAVDTVTALFARMGERVVRLGEVMDDPAGVTYHGRLALAL